MIPTVPLRLLALAPAAVLVTVAATTALPAGTAARAATPTELSVGTPVPERSTGSSRRDARLVLAVVATPAGPADSGVPPAPERTTQARRSAPVAIEDAAAARAPAVPRSVQASVAVPAEASAVVPVDAPADLAAVPVPEPAPVREPAPVAEPTPTPTADPETVPIPARLVAPELEAPAVPEPRPAPAAAPAPLPVAAAVPGSAAAPVPAPVSEPLPVAVPVAEPAAAPAPARVSLPAAAAELVRRVAEEREAAGCPELTVDPELTVAAKRHATDMVRRKFFSHTGSDGSDASSRAAAAGASVPVAENLAAGQTSARAVVKEWSASPAHRETMLDCDWTRTGVAYDGGRVGSAVKGVWVQLFG